MERITDHVEQAKSLLIWQYQGRVRMEAVLSSWVRQVQLLDDATYDVGWKRLIDFAESTQLDVVGKIVGEDRQGDLDDVYRIFIGARIKVNRSRGTLPDVLGVLSVIDGDVPVRANDVTCGIDIVFLEEPSRPVRIYSMLRAAKPGGIGLSMVVPASEPDRTLLFNSVGDASDPAHAYGDTTASFDAGIPGDAVTLR